MGNFLHLLLWGIIFALCVDFIYFRTKKSERKLNYERKKLTTNDKFLGNLLASLYYWGYLGSIVAILLLRAHYDINIENSICFFLILVVSVSFIAELFNFSMQHFKKKNMFEIMEYTTKFTPRWIFMLRVFPFFFLIFYSIIIISNLHL